MDYQDNVILSDLAIKMFRLRRKVHVSLEELSKRTGFSKEYIFDMESLAIPFTEEDALKIFSAYSNDELIKANNHIR